MPSVTPHPLLQASSSRAYLVGWLFAITLVFGFGWWLSAENLRVYQAQINWNAGQRKFITARDAEQARVLAELRPLLGKPRSRQRIELLLNNGQPLVTQTKDGREVAVWENPEYAFGFEFQFRGDEVAGWIGNQDKDRSAEARWDYSQFPTVSHTYAMVRSSIAAIGIFAWLVALAAWFLFPTKRLRAALAMLLGSLACGTAWLNGPFFTRWIFHNEGLYPAAIMLFLSIYVLSATLVELKTQGVSFPPFRFRLRELLTAIVVVSLVLAVGPFGYFTLFVALLTSLLFAIVYSVHRRWNPFGMHGVPA